jgi:hypothetical protein
MGTFDLDTSKNGSRIGGFVIQSVISEAEHRYDGTDAKVLRH